MAKITAYVPEPTDDYKVDNSTIKDQLNFSFQKDLKDELEAFSWFLFSGPKN
jgi:hypothetical protein